MSTLEWATEHCLSICRFEDTPAKEPSAVVTHPGTIVMVGTSRFSTDRTQSIHLKWTMLSTGRVRASLLLLADKSGLIFNNDSSVTYYSQYLYNLYCIVWVTRISIYRDTSQVAVTLCYQNFCPKMKCTVHLN